MGMSYGQLFDLMNLAAKKKKKSYLHLNKMDMAYLRVGKLTIYDDEYNSTLTMLYDIGKKLLASLQQCDCDFIG